MRAPLIWQIIREKDYWISLHVDLKRLNPNTETKPYAAIICQPAEIQVNHKPAKMLLTEKKKGVSQNGQTPSIIGICSYCVLDSPAFKRCQTLLHPELTPWWSFLLADGAHHKKPHSPTHPKTDRHNIQTDRQIDRQTKRKDSERNHTFKGRQGITVNGCLAFGLVSPGNYTSRHAIEIQTT